MSSPSAAAFSRAVDVDLRLDDRHQPGVEDLLADVELLGDDRVHAGLVRQLDDRAHLRAEHALGHGAGEQLVEPGDRLHHLHAVGLVGQPLVDLEERHDVLDVPQVARRVAALDGAVHRLLEQDRPDAPARR